jgi:hypothetical protein
VITLENNRYTDTHENLQEHFFQTVSNDSYLIFWCFFRDYVVAQIRR